MSLNEAHLISCCTEAGTEASHSREGWRLEAGSVPSCLPYPAVCVRRFQTDSGLAGKDKSVCLGKLTD